MFFATSESGPLVVRFEHLVVGHPAALENASWERLPAKKYRKQVKGYVLFQTETRREMGCQLTGTKSQ